ncbi:lipoprotein [Marinicella sediminis]|uniref:Lipoprotein n=1 Tax=Marinicella sediminis TaxID=1792834 RepID=A0ABV7J663_9GAMM|nr:lipoprotein [Marinicella sediminis]
MKNKQPVIAWLKSINKTLTSVVFFALALTACGNKGDLYIPDEPAESAAQTAQETNP